MASLSNRTTYRQRFSIVSLIFLHLWATTFVGAQSASFDLNPVTNFCSRWYSQSVIKDDILYIDSGLQKWNGTNIKKPIFGINNYILTIPLDYTWDWKHNIAIQADPKNETNPKTGTLPPSLIRGHMFHGPANTSEVYVFGGTTYMGNQSFEGYTRPDSSSYPLWTYVNNNLSDYPWNQYDINQLWMPNHGAATEAIDQGLGFYLNGQIDWGTSTTTYEQFNSEQLYTPLDGMLVINLVNHSSKNISTSSIRGSISRVGGTMEYFAPVGDMGILVALGGQIQPDWTGGYANVTKGELIDFSSVDIFDIDSYLKTPESNGTWYQQNTTGDIPPPRIDFCSVSASAPDNTSHHIYIYGGQDPVSNKTYDDVVILSLPSFTWTNVWPIGTSPRWGHNCHVGGKRQMITIGGNTTTPNKIDCDWEKKGVAVWEMSTSIWGSVFTSNISDYQVPDKVLYATGGTVDGGATIKEPTEGWTDGGLKTIFDKGRWLHTDSGSTQPPTKKTNIGAIVGGVVGGVAFLAVVAGLFSFWRRKYLKSKGPHELENAEHHPELPHEKRKYELQGVNENDPAELPGPEAAELNAPRELVEADRDTATNAVELPATNVAGGGLHGVPIVRTPGDDLPEPPLYLPGLIRRLSQSNSPPPEAQEQGETPGKEIQQAPDSKNSPPASHKQDESAREEKQKEPDKPAKKEAEEDTNGCSKNASK